MRILVRLASVCMLLAASGALLVSCGPPIPGGTVTVTVTGLSSFSGKTFYAAVRENRPGTTWIAGWFAPVPLDGSIEPVVLYDYVAAGKPDWVSRGGTSYLLSYYVDVVNFSDNGPDAGDYEGTRLFLADGDEVFALTYPADFTLVE